MSVHLSNMSKTSRSPCNFVQLPPSTATASSSSSPPPLPLPPLLDAALMAVVQQQPSRTSPHHSHRNLFICLFMHSAGAHPSLSSSSSPKLPKAGVTNGFPPLPPALPAPSSTSNGPSQAQHHLPLLATHSFLYNPAEPYIFPITIPPGFPSTAPDFMRLFAPNMAAASTSATNTTSTSGTNFVSTSNVPQGSAATTRSNTQSNGTNTPPEQNGQHRHPSPPLPPTSSRQQQPQQSHQSQSHYRPRQHYLSDSIQYQQNGGHPQQQQQRQSQASYSQQSHNRPKACYTCGDLGHLAFACPEQYPSDSNYPHNSNRGRCPLRIIDGRRARLH